MSGGKTMRDTVSAQSIRNAQEIPLDPVGRQSFGGTEKVERDTKDTGNGEVAKGYRWQQNWESLQQYKPPKTYTYVYMELDQTDIPTSLLELMRGSIYIASIGA
jgi:hypothetical protein